MNQQQTKPEPLGAPMAKLVLVVSFIVGIGAVLGVLGYALTKQKPAVQKPPAIEKADKTADLSSKALATEDWNTYRNEEFGFEVKYPENAEIEEFTSGITELIASLIFPSRNNISKIMLIEIRQPDNNGCICKNPAMAAYAPVAKNYKKEVIKKGNLNFTKETAEEIGVNPIYYRHYSIFNNYDRFQCITFCNSITSKSELSKDEREKESEIFDQILSTFKFIESVERKITEIKNAIIYPNKQTVWNTGETYLIQWTSKDINGTVDIRLYDNTTIDNATRLVFQPSISPKDTGHYSFTVFKGLKPGSRYQFEITQYPIGESLFSEEFTIVGK